MVPVYVYHKSIQINVSKFKGCEADTRVCLGSKIKNLTHYSYKTNDNALMIMKLVNVKQKLK